MKQYWKFEAKIHTTDFIHLSANLEYQFLRGGTESIDLFSQAFATVSGHVCSALCSELIELLDVGGVHVFCVGEESGGLDTPRLYLLLFSRSE